MSLISIIVPAFNAENYISETLTSINNQEYKNLEIIVVDDGSTDATSEIVREFDEVKLIKQFNAGVSAARNHGVKQSAGDLIAFCDADDVWYPNKLTEQLKLHEKYKWSYTDSEYFGNNTSLDGKKRSDLSRLHSGTIFEKLILENFLTTSSIMLEKSLLIKHGGFDENLPAMEDWKLWLKIAEENPIGFCSMPLLKYRVHQTSTSRSARRSLPLHLKVIDEIFQELPNNKKNSILKKQAIANSFSICSYIAEESNDNVFALYCSLKQFALSSNKNAAFIRIARSSLNLFPLKKK